MWGGLVSILYSSRVHSRVSADPKDSRHLHVSCFGSGHAPLPRYPWRLPRSREYGGPDLGDPTTRDWYTVLGRTYGRILDSSFGGRTENGHEMVLDLVYRAHFFKVRSTPFSEPELFKEVLGPSLAEKRPKTETQI